MMEPRFAAATSLGLSAKVASPAEPCESPG